MATVYRVECPDCKHGPYTCECIHRGRLSWRDAAKEMYHYTDAYLRSHPGMLVDAPMRRIVGHWLCGFATIEDLLWWFQDDLDGLRKAGFIMVILETKDLLRGQSKRQVFFDYDYEYRMEQKLP